MQSNSSSFKKITLIAFVPILVGVILCFLYFLFLHPIVSHFFVPSWIYNNGIHKGIEYYDNKKYVEFQSGEKFERLLSSTNYLSSGEVIDFYHINNFFKDDLIRGKMCDIYALDIQLSDSGFYSMQFDDTDLCNNMEDFKLYLLSEYICESTSDIALIAACEQNRIIRIILITDAEQYEFRSDYGRVLMRQSSLQWSLQEGQGDGLCLDR